MRRTLLAALAVAMLVPATAQAAVPDQHNVPAGRTAQRTMDTNRAAALFHQDAYVSGVRCWLDTRSRRNYCLRAAAYINHAGNDWQAEVWINATRSYGGVTVNTPYNLDVAGFQALRFGSFTAVPNEVFTANPANSTCRTGSRVITSQTRAAVVWAPVVESYIGLILMRFLTVDGCRSLHLTNSYQLGSRQVHLATEAEANDPVRTGLYAF